MQARKTEIDELYLDEYMCWHDGLVGVLETFTGRTRKSAVHIELSHL